MQTAFLLLFGLAAATVTHRSLRQLRLLLQARAERRRRIALALGVVGRDSLGRGSGRRAGLALADARSALEALSYRAGQPAELSLEGLLWRCSLLAAIPLLALVVLDLGLWLALPLAVGAGLVPLFWLRQRAETRRIEIVRALPGFMDLLVLSVESGLDFTSAVRRIVARAAPSPLMEEMRLLIMEIRLGTTRREALRNVAQRLRIPEISALAMAIGQADQYGAPLGRTLRVQAEQVRERRYQRAEERAGRAAVLVSLPTVLFLVPCVFLILVGPYLPEVMSTLNTGF